MLEVAHRMEQMELVHVETAELKEPSEKGKALPRVQIPMRVKTP